MTMKKKKYNARFPPARIKKIMQTDEDVGKVAQPVPVIISRALELFVESLLKKANDITAQRGARTLTPSHLKMCIKSEKRFDFLKELVSTVPDLQGDHDEPSTPGATAVGLDLTMSTLTAAETAAKDQTKNTSSLLAARLTKLPRQLSTAPRPRGRPRTVSADSESKIPKKRRKKRQPKFVDDPEEAAVGGDSDTLSTNGDEDQVFDEATTTSSTTTSTSSIVTCTVTTGLTHLNGFNNGSVLGFTLSIPSTSLSSSQNGLKATAETKAKDHNGIEDENLALAAQNSTKANNVQDVDEDYDDC